MRGESFGYWYGYCGRLSGGTQKEERIECRNQSQKTPGTPSTEECQTDEMTGPIPPNAANDEENTAGNSKVKESVQLSSHLPNILL